MAAFGRPRIATFDPMVTRRSASRYGRGRSSTASTTLKMALLAPIPSASVSTTARVKPGLRRSARKA